MGDLVFDIACKYAASGVKREASVWTTTTGVRWTISGDLAEAIAAWNRRPAPDLPRHAGEDDLVERLRGVDNDDHERLCQGREYACTCGYDERIRQAALDAAARISSDSALLATVTRERDEAVKAHAAACHNGAEKARRLGVEKYDVETRLQAAEAALAAVRQQAIEECRGHVREVANIANMLWNDNVNRDENEYLRDAAWDLDKRIAALSETKAS